MRREKEVQVCSVRRKVRVLEGTAARTLSFQ